MTLPLIAILHEMNTGGQLDVDDTLCDLPAFSCSGIACSNCPLFVSNIPEYKGYLTEILTYEVRDPTAD